MNKRRMTYNQALDEFFGGIHGLNKQKLPFNCSCGHNSYIATNGVIMPIMTVPETFSHIRQSHNIIITNRKKHNE